ncbi:helix-turn-helix domain-containing protein [Puia dinghuensis]|uniref:AraC family transcriptional regulator n=1 Tax=Puia dinghuensis TaxID=1792502 RepID=A0A8J2UDD1_9BACT|nr:helix-turn-helix domain-containing protein [Puia dinghuensis]GGB02136.1 AraC family transcriptional regulator [Puia dinghuensis]
MMSSVKIFAESAIYNSFSVERMNDRIFDNGFPNRLSYHRILLVEKGKGALSVDGNAFEIHGREVFLLAKGQIYNFDQLTVVSGYLLCFGDCFWEKAPSSASNCKAVLFNNAAANQRLRLNDTEMAELTSLFDALQAEHDAPAYTNQIDAMAAYLKIIMIKLANIKITEEGTFDSQDYVLYRKFMEELSARFRDCHEVSDYAQRLGITARRLSDLCKRCSNKSAKEIINGQLIAEAKRSLQFSSSPVKEIAYHLSFGTPEQFSHFFKKNTKMSPASYRNHFISIGVQ